MIKGFNHTSFTVENVDQAVQFWTEGLGFRAASVSERSGDWQGRITGVPGARLKIAHLFGYGQHVELIEYLEGSENGVPMRPNLPGMAHVCLDVEDIQDTVAVLISLGARPHGELVAVDSGPVKGCRSIFATPAESLSSWKKWKVGSSARLSSSVLSEFNSSRRLSSRSKIVYPNPNSEPRASRSLPGPILISLGILAVDPCLR